MKPRLLDLFCGAGGAARGYQLAGWHVTGVDHRPQPRYAGDEFIEGDALEYAAGHWWRFDAIHASPPCQAFTAMQRAAGRATDHPDLIPATREVLIATGRPWVIENVPGAPLAGAYLLCGATLGLEVVRHRLFETSFFMWALPCLHVPGGTTTGQYVAFRHSGRVAPGRIVPPRRTEREFRQAIECDWMTLREARQAIPPAMTSYVGEQLLAHVREVSADVLV